MVSSSREAVNVNVKKNFILSLRRWCWYLGGGCSPAGDRLLDEVCEGAREAGDRVWRAGQVIDVDDQAAAVRGHEHINTHERHAHVRTDGGHNRMHLRRACQQRRLVGGSCGGAGRGGSRGSGSGGGGGGSHNCAAITIATTAAIAGDRIRRASTGEVARAANEPCRTSTESSEFRLGRPEGRAASQKRRAESCEGKPHAPCGGLGRWSATGDATGSTAGTHSEVWK